jgi:hypothetical protein
MQIMLCFAGTIKTIVAYNLMLEGFYNLFFTHNRNWIKYLTVASDGLLDLLRVVDKRQYGIAHCSIKKLIFFLIKTII